MAINGLKNRWSLYKLLPKRRWKEFSAFFSRPYLTFIISGVLIITAVIRAIIKRDWRRYLSRLISPGFVIFSLIFLVLNVANYGKLASSWDEFSHWADVVKAMTSINDFATNPLSQSAFKSYPPAMPLFQYNLQVFSQIVSSSAVFSEWRLYLSYQLITYMLLMPVFKHFQWKNIGRVMVSGILVFLLPSMFYSFYDIIYIDAFVGVAAGYSLYTFVQTDSGEKFEYIGAVLSISLLVLSKDVGFLLACFLGVLFASRELVEAFRSKKHLNFLLVSVMLLSILVPQLIWNMVIQSNNVARSFSNSINFQTLLNTIRVRDPEDYRWKTLQNFFTGLVDSRVEVGNSNLMISNIMLFLGIFSFLIYQTARGEGGNISTNTVKHIFFGSTGLIALYVLGMCVMYMFKFSEYEAVRLASFQRYMNILATMLVICASLIALAHFSRAKELIDLRRATIVLAFIMMVTPLSSAKKFLFGEYVQSSIVTRQPYDNLVRSISPILDGKESKVYIVSQEDTGFDYWVLRYSIRPAIASSGFSWSLGKPFYDGDIWSKTVNEAQWKQELKNNYDYVLLYKINNYFIDEFADLFEEKHYIVPKSLYSVNKSDGTLKPEGWALSNVFSDNKTYSSTSEFTSTIDMAPIIDKYGLSKYLISFDIKSSRSGKVLVYQQNGSTSKYGFQAYIQATESWERHSILVEPALVNVNETMSMLAFYGDYGSGIITEVSNILVQIVDDAK